MKLDAIVLKLRLAATTFGNNIGGAASLARARRETLQDLVPCAWVYETGIIATPNEHASETIQIIEETFAVLVVIKNLTDEPGANAFNTLDDIRTELTDCLLGWVMPGYERPIEFGGGSLIAVNEAFLVYQYSFSAKKRIQPETPDTDSLDDFLRLYGIDEHLVNGNFDTDTDWTKGDGWTIANGKASCDGSQGDVSNLSQEITNLVQGIPYTVRFTVVSYTSGSLTPILGGQTGTPVTEEGDFSEVITTLTADKYFHLQASADFVGEVDAVQVGAGYGIDLSIDGLIDAEVTVDLPGPS